MILASSQESAGQEASSGRGGWSLYRAVLLGLGVFLLGHLGEWFGRLSGGQLTPVLPAEGLAFAGVIVLGFHYGLPAVLAGSFFGELTGGASWDQAGLEALAIIAGLASGRMFFTSVLRGDPGLLTLKDFFKFVLAGCGAAALQIAVTICLVQGVLGGGLSLAYVLDLYQALALGILLFGPFSLFLFRRQDLRPSDLQGAYEMLLYSTLLAWIIYTVLTLDVLENQEILILGTGAVLLGLLVALRFGLRPASLFCVMASFLIPAFVVIFPDRVDWQRLIFQAGTTVNDPGLLALIAILGCFLLGAFRDELVTLRIKFNLAISSADMCVWEWSPAGWSCHTLSWCRKFGLPNGKPLPENRVLELIHPEDVESYQGSFGAFLATGGDHWEATYRMRDLEGRWCWVQSRAQMLRRTADDDLLVIAGVTLDITREQEAVNLRITAIENEAELKTLRSQLNPHFLFNSLNSVRALIGRNDEKARVMITALGKLLRDLLSMRGDISHSLGKELEIVETYLQIEAIRFGDRLNYELDVEPASLNRVVPGMMVQTLVENGVKHGISKLEKGGRLLVRVRIDPSDNFLHISVSNDGPLGGPSDGFGVENTRRRIALATGGRGTISLQELPGPRVEATVVIPPDPASPAARQVRSSPSAATANL